MHLQLLRPIVILIAASVSTGVLGDDSKSPQSEPARPERHWVARQIYEQTTVDETVVVRKPVVVTEMQERTMTVRKPIVATELREQRRIVRRPVTETVYKDETLSVERPYNETTYQEQVRTVRKPVIETTLQERTSTVYETQTSYVSLYSNGMEIQTPTTVTVPRTVVERVPVQSVRYVEEQVVEHVPQTVRRIGTEQVVRKVPVVQTNFVEEEVVEKVPVEVERFVEEQVVRRVPIETTKLVDETVVMRVPKLTAKTIYEERDGPAPQGATSSTGTAPPYSSAVAPERPTLPPDFNAPNGPHSPAPSGSPPPTFRDDARSTTANRPLVIENARVVISGSEVSISPPAEKK